MFFKFLRNVSVLLKRKNPTDFLSKILRETKKDKLNSLSFSYHIQLNSTFNLIGTEASCTDVDMAGRTVNDCLHALYVGLPCTVRTSVGMGNLNAKRHTLAANIALCQLLHLQSSKNHLKYGFIHTDRYITKLFLKKQEKNCKKYIFFEDGCEIALNRL